jgi:hypothetical protein
MLHSARTVALTLVLLLAACGSDDPFDPGEGETATFQATVSGAVNATLSGFAQFGTIPNEAFVLTLNADDQSGVISVELEDTSRPGPGTIQLGGQSSGAFGFGSIQGGIFFSVEGNFTITSSSSSALVGTLQFDALTPEGGEVTVSATFTADCVTVCS